MRRSLILMTVCAVLWPGDLEAKDRTTEEFTEYAQRRMLDPDAKKLEAYVAAVDADDDGVVSSDEFANRIEVYQKIFRTVAPVPRKKGHALPDNWTKNYDEALKEAADSGKPVVVMFSASWCGPCKMMISNVFPTEQVKKGLASFVPVYIDSEKETELASKSEIRAYPTFVCFDQEGNEIARHVGGGTVEKFLQVLDTFSAKVEIAAESGE